MARAYGGSDQEKLPALQTRAEQEHRLIHIRG